MNILNPQQARKIILDTEGRIFGVEFIKKDLTIRKMSCRLGVQKDVKHIVDREAEDTKHNLLTVFDFNADRDNKHQGGFRRINLKTLVKIKVKGTEYEIRNRF